MTLHLRILLVAAIASAASGCARFPSVPLDPHRLHELEPLQRGERIEVRDDEGPATVSPEDDPFLAIERRTSCSVFEPKTSFVDCIPQFHARPEDVVVLGDRLVVRGQWPLPDAEIPFAHLESLRLVWNPADRRREFGVGLNVLGPARLVGIGAQWLPGNWMALEAGFTVPFPGLGGTAWTGFRLRPVAIGPVRPFAGAFANVAAYPAPDDAPKGTSRADFSAGPRLGLDLHLGRSLLLTGELDSFLYRSNPASGLSFEQGRERLLSVGLSLTFLY